MIEAGQVDGAVAKPSVPPAAARPAAPAAKPEVAPTAEPEVDEAPNDDDAPDAGESTTAATAAPDPETAKRIAAIQLAEKRSREKAGAARAELDKRAKDIETEWSPKIKRADDFDALLAKAAKARSNPAALVDVFRALGYTEAHFEGAAQALYALSEKGQADPARRAHAERLLADRAELERGDATQRELRELKDQLAAKDQQAEMRQLQAGYLEGVTDAVTEATPIAKAALAGIEKARADGTPAGRARAAKLAAKLRNRLWDITTTMTAEADGDVPEHADVVARYEQIRGEELDELDIPRPNAATTTAPTKKPNTPPADKQNPARTLSNDLSTTRVPRPVQSGDEGRKQHRKDTLKALESGKLE